MFDELEPSIEGEFRLAISDGDRIEPVLQLVVRSKSGAAKIRQDRCAGRIGHSSFTKSCSGTAGMCGASSARWPR